MIERPTFRPAMSGRRWRPESQRGAVAPAVPEALTGSDFQLLASDAGPLWMDVNDNVIRPYIDRLGTWEPEEGRLLRSLIKPGCRFLDVGANVGYFSMFAHHCAPGVVVDAVEPVPLNLQLLRFNIWINGVDATVWPLALTAGERFVAMSVAENNFGDSRAHTVDGDGTVENCIVAAARADDIFVGRGFDVIKIDVQGFELDVLRGMAGTLERSPDVVIVSEFWAAGLRERGREPMAVLADLRALGLRFDVQTGDNLSSMTDQAIVRHCDAMGRDGQVNLVLRHA